MLVCPNCSSETNGLKLNNRLYCTECGFLLSAPQPETPEVKPQVIKTSDSADLSAPTLETEPEAKIISDRAESDVLAPLEAEEEVLDLVIDEAKKLEEENGEEDTASIEVPLKTKLPASNNKIQKHNRPRVDLKKEGSFVLIPGEPDPIAEPEIVAAEAEEAIEPAEEPVAPEPIPVKVEDIKEPEEEVEPEPTELPEPVEPPTNEEDTPDTKEPEKAEHKEANPNSDLLLNYFRQANKVEPTKPKGKKKKKKGFRWKLFFAIFIPLFIVLCLAGLVGYVNLYAIKPDIAVKRAEQKATFAHLKAGYLPAGYALSYKTTGDASGITYAYDYQPDPTKTLTIKAEKTNFEPDDIRPKVVDPLKTTFTNTNVGDRSLWLVGDDRLYFIESGILYTLTSNSNVSSTELIKVAADLK